MVGERALNHVYPLDGVVIVDISRLAITFVSKLLCDLGATTIAIEPPAHLAERLNTPYSSGPEAREVDPASHKLHLQLDLKDPEGRATLYDAVRVADVFIEGYRPGVAARLGCSYEVIREINPDVVYASVTGYGQTGPRASHPGHDINYISVAGAQSLVSTPNGTHAIPLNIIADMAGGGMYGAMVICAALFHRSLTGAGTYLDVGMTDGVATLISGILDGAKTNGEPPSEDFFWPRQRHRAKGGEGMLGGRAPFYRIYQSADGLPLSVGCIEPQFWAELCKMTELTNYLGEQLNESAWPEMCKSFEIAFARMPRDYWLTMAAQRDTCVTPVLSPAEVRQDPHMEGRKRDGIYGGLRVQQVDGPASRKSAAAVLAERQLPQQILTKLL